MNGLFASFEEGKSPEIIAVTLHFVKKKKKKLIPKNSYQEIKHSIN